MADFAFHFTGVEFDKKRPHTLTFKGHCTNANGREVTIKYTGPDISNESSVVVPEDILYQLHAELKSDFGYGAFNSKDAKSQLSAKNSYYFDYN